MEIQRPGSFTSISVGSCRERLCFYQNHMTAIVNSCMMPYKKLNRTNCVIGSQYRNGIGEIIHDKNQRESGGLIIYLSLTLPIDTDCITLFLYR